MASCAHTDTSPWRFPFLPAHWFGHLAQTSLLASQADRMSANACTMRALPPSQLAGETFRALLYRL